MIHPRSPGRLAGKAPRSALALCALLAASAACGQADETEIDDEQPPGPCSIQASGGIWLDKLQRTVHRSVCSTALWFDHFFGETSQQRLLDETYGRIGAGFEWDERDGFDPQLRLRAKFALPALENRLGLLIGRGDEGELVEDGPGAARDALPSSVRDVRDDDWLVGLGYSSRPGEKFDFDFRAGIRLGTPVEPYVKGIWRFRHPLGDLSVFRLRETVFWRDTRGFGETTHLEIDRLLGKDWLLRWTDTLTLAEDVDGLEWESSLGFFHNLSPRRAIVYSGLVRGETRAEVPLQNYGLEIRYRQRIARQWLFVELLGSLTWPRETLMEKREANIGLGLGFEMYFGRVPDHAMP